MEEKITPKTTIEIAQELAETWTLNKRVEEKLEEKLNQLIEKNGTKMLARGGLIKNLSLSLRWALKHITWQLEERHVQTGRVIKVACSFCGQKAKDPALVKHLPGCQFQMALNLIEEWEEIYRK